MATSRAAAAEKRIAELAKRMEVLEGGGSGDRSPRVHVKLYGAGSLRPEQPHNHRRLPHRIICGGGRSAAGLSETGSRQIKDDTRYSREVAIDPVDHA